MSGDQGVPGKPMNMADAVTNDSVSSGIRGDSIGIEETGGQDARIELLSREARQCPRWLRPWPLSISLAVHYTFVTIALVTTTTNPWLPAYFFSHIVVILAGVWAARDERKIQPVLLYMYIVTMSIMVDCLQIGLFFQTFNQRTQEQSATDRGVWFLSVTAASLHLVMKPVCLVFGVFVILDRRPDLYRGVCRWQSGDSTKLT